MMAPKKAKEHCGYEQRPIFNTCGNCAAFTSEFRVPAWVKDEVMLANFEDGTYKKNECGMRCIDHGFAVKKLATCKLWRANYVVAVPLVECLTVPLGKR